MRRDADGTYGVGCGMQGGMQGGRVRRVTAGMAASAPQGHIVFGTHAPLPPAHSPPPNEQHAAAAANHHACQAARAPQPPPIRQESHPRVFKTSHTQPCRPSPHSHLAPNTLSKHPLPTLSPGASRACACIAARGGPQCTHPITQQRRRVDATAAAALRAGCPERAPP